MNNYWYTNYKASQGGDFTFRYFITSGQKLGDADLARFSAETRCPLIGYNYYQYGVQRAAKKRLPLGQGAFFDLDASHAQVTAFKKAEDGDGYILRLLETTGQEGVASFRSPIFPLAASYLTSGVEENLSPLAVKKDGVQIPLRPREFTTVRLVFGAKAGVIRSRSLAQ